MKLICLQFIIIFVFVNSILHAKEALRIRRNAIKDVRFLWPKAIVPYTISKDFSNSERQVIFKSMEHIQLVSCVRFKGYSGEAGYVDVVKGKGKDDKCSSITGYTGHRQEIVLGTGCVWYTTVLHELFHTLGFFHEHARPDRDKHVRINQNNIQPDKFSNFRKLSPDIVTTLDIPYDYKSLLHYTKKHFVIDGRLNSIEPIRGQPDIGNAKGMSKLDVVKLNTLYRCPLRYHG